MEKKKTNSPSNFENAFTKLGFDQPEQVASATNLDNEILDKEDVSDINAIEDPVKTTEDLKGDEGNEDETVKGVHDDDTEIPEEVLNKKPNEDNKIIDEEETTKEETTDEGLEDSDEVDPQEATQVGAFFDAFADTLGWDVDDETKPDTIEGLVDYIKDLVDENSQPDYANDQIKQLDEYVKNGGSFTDFYNNMS